ncbi:MAG TPA: hypothetical protein VGK78_07575 [Nocardioides sp.]|uniref:hypothetical protein n=1 Tax=Nocardioides sp. TaxID=35761 RepID=UPI002F42ADA7
MSVAISPGRRADKPAGLHGKVAIVAQHPMGRIGEPDEVATAIVFRPPTRPRSSPMRCCRPVDGGFLAR